jgi:hypothetical protein
MSRPFLAFSAGGSHSAAPQQQPQCSTIAMPSAGARHRRRGGHARMGAIVLPSVQNQY